MLGVALLRSVQPQSCMTAGPAQRHLHGSSLAGAAAVHARAGLPRGIALAEQQRRTRPFLTTALVTRQTPSSHQPSSYHAFSPSPLLSLGTQEIQRHARLRGRCTPVPPPALCVSRARVPFFFFFCCLSSHLTDPACLPPLLHALLRPCSQRAFIFLHKALHTRLREDKKLNKRAIIDPNPRRRRC